MDRKIYWTCRHPSEDLPVSPYRVEVEPDRYAGCFCRVIDAKPLTHVKLNATDLYDERDSALSNAIAECNRIIAAAEERKVTLGNFGEPS